MHNNFVGKNRFELVCSQLVAMILPMRNDSTPWPSAAISYFPDLSGIGYRKNTLVEDDVLVISDSSKFDFRYSDLSPGFD